MTKGWNSSVRRLFWFILVFCLGACSGSPTNPQDITVQTHIKHGERTNSRICGTRVGCGKIEPLECINVMHSIVQHYMKTASFFIQSGAERSCIVTEFSNALCRLQDIEAELKKLKLNNFNEWKVLYDSGFITQLKMMIVAISVEIFSPHKVEDDPISHTL